MWKLWNKLLRIESEQLEKLQLGAQREKQASWNEKSESESAESERMKQRLEQSAESDIDSAQSVFVPWKLCFSNFPNLACSRVPPLCTVRGSAKHFLHFFFSSPFKSDCHVFASWCKLHLFNQPCNSTHWFSPPCPINLNFLAMI